MMRAKILIVEDDPDIRQMLSFGFANEPWDLTLAGDGETGLRNIEKHSFDCIILDIMLPGIDGIEVLKNIKKDEKKSQVPVIMTTAKGEDSDVVAGLELGADDYVVKPYSLKVLIARIRTALRRKNTEQSDKQVWEQGDVRIDVPRHEAFYKNSPLDLSATEFAILQVFVSRPEEVFTRGKIIQAIRGDDYPVTDRSVDVQILALRKKLGTAGEMIETVRGVGYRFRSI